MAVTITVLEIAADRRVGDGTTPLEEPELGILTRLLASATETVHNYANDAPEAVQNTAASLIVGYLYDAPVADGSRYSNALSNSGAQSLLSRWASRRVTVIE